MCDDDYDLTLALSKRPGEAINRIYRAAYDMQARAAVIDKGISIGDKVCFDARGRTHEGIVTKINPKSVGVAVAGGPAWRVSPHLLTKV